MRHVLPTLPALLLFALSVTNPLLADEPVRVRVLSYNIHHAEGTDGKLDLERIAGIIKSSRADLVALQEIDYVNDRTGRIDQAAELARLTGLTAIAGDNIDYRGGRYGNAALVRWPVVAHKDHALPLVRNEQRGVLAVELAADTAKDRPPLSFLVTHLDHQAGDAERLASAKFINRLVSDSEGPAILAGDLNATPDSPTLAQFANEWENPTAAAPLPTHPAAKPRRQIDFVLSRPVGKWKLVESRVLDEPVASDHRPLLVVLEWQPD